MGGARFTNVVWFQLFAAQLESVMGLVAPSSPSSAAPPSVASSPTVASASPSTSGEPELDPEGDPELDAGLPSALLVGPPESPPFPLLHAAIAMAASAENKAVREGLCVKMCVDIDVVKVVSAYARHATRARSGRDHPFVPSDQSLARAECVVASAR